MTTTYGTNTYPIQTEETDEIDFTAIVHEWVRQQHANARQAAARIRDRSN